jgi:hypothetical protein
LTSSTPSTARVKFVLGLFFELVFLGGNYAHSGKDYIARTVGRYHRDRHHRSDPRNRCGLPNRKRKLCIQETVAGHTFKHDATTNECLMAKWSSDAKILNEGACASH